MPCATIPEVQYPTGPASRRIMLSLRRWPGLSHFTRNAGVSFKSRIGRCFGPVRRASWRFPALGMRASATSDEGLATAAALETFRRGGNAADAIVSVAAALHVIQPVACGVGGDCFGVVYDARTGIVHCVDGSGRSPAALTLQRFQSGHSGDSVKTDCRGILATVPGVVKAWFETLNVFGSGKLTMAELMEPAIRYAEEGFPVGWSSAAWWGAARRRLAQMHEGSLFLKEDGRTPKPGDVFRNVPLARLLKRIGNEGPEVFYSGDIAESIVQAVSAAGGIMTLDDLQKHMNSAEPVIVPTISTTYRGRTVHTPPLPSQGAILLEGLNIMEGFDVQSFKSDPGQFYHLLIEALRLAFVDGLSVISDPGFASTDKMINKEYGRKKSCAIDVNKAMVSCAPEGLPTLRQRGTVTMATADAQGNACCFIGSLGTPCGSTIVRKHGFAVQARAEGFNMVPGHPNCAGPYKKPYHTLMPVIVTDTASGKLLAVMGSRAAGAQAQTILQVLLAMIDLGLNPQEAVDMPRIKIGGTRSTHPDDPILIEEEMSTAAIESLTEKGHTIGETLRRLGRSNTGQVHVITKGNWWDKGASQDLVVNSDVLWTGTDFRCDGKAMTY